VQPFKNYRYRSQAKYENQDTDTFLLALMSNYCTRQKLGRSAYQNGRDYSCILMLQRANQRGADIREKPNHEKHTSLEKNTLL